MKIIKREKMEKENHSGSSNYELMRDLMEKEFLKYDQQKMIDKFHLKNSEQYLYLNFVGRECRIGRTAICQEPMRQSTMSKKECLWPPQGRESFGKKAVILQDTANS